MRIQGMPKEERPREKMIFAGKEALSNSELLAILLRAGTKNKSALQIAAEILSQNESGILYLESCSPEELSEIKGVGMAKACQILAAVELGKRIASHPPKVRKEIENPDDIVQLFMGKMRYYKKEHFKVLLINAKGEILEEHEIYAPRRYIPEKCSVRRSKGARRRYFLYTIIPAAIRRPAGRTWRLQRGC